MNLLQAENISHYFGGLAAVVGVDFCLEDRGIHAIIGPNGAGKTTFVSLLCGRLPCSTGTIRFHGEEITTLPAWQRVRRGIAYTFQITSIYPRLRVRENIAIAVLGRIPQHGGLAHRVAGILAQVGLSEQADEVAGNLPYGHQRLLEVGMGLALTPRLLILDEPTQGLSDPEISDFSTLVTRIGQDATVLLIEHNMQVVMGLAQQITVFDQGQVLARGTPAEIRSNAAVQNAYLGTARIP